MTWFVNTLRLALALGLPVAANAQVTMDQGALDSLAKPPAHPAPPHPAPVHHAPVHRATTATHGTPPKPGPVRPVPPTVAAPLPVIPPAAPPPPVIPPPIVVPTMAAPPPPPVPVVATAAGAASDIPGGLRITFGPDSADLNHDTAAALTALARRARDHGDAAINLLAHAPGVPADPSSPRRLSMTRGLAARAVLINQGIPSTRIYVRALGAQDLGDGPADRVDVFLGPAPLPAAPPK